MCIDIAEVCFGNAYGQILLTFDRVICLGYDSDGVLSFHVFILLWQSVISLHLSVNCFCFEFKCSWSFLLYILIGKKKRIIQVFKYSLLVTEL